MIHRYNTTSQMSCANLNVEFMADISRQLSSDQDSVSQRNLNWMNKILQDTFLISLESVLHQKLQENENSSQPNRKGMFPNCLVDAHFLNCQIKLTQRTQISQNLNKIVPNNQVHEFPSSNEGESFEKTNRSNNIKSRNSCSSGRNMKKTLLQIPCSYVEHSKKRKLFYLMKQNGAQTLNTTQPIQNIDDKENVDQSNSSFILDKQQKDLKKDLSKQKEDSIINYTNKGIKSVNSMPKRRGSMKQQTSFQGQVNSLQIEPNQQKQQSNKYQNSTNHQQKPPSNYDINQNNSLKTPSSLSQCRALFGQLHQIQSLKQTSTRTDEIESNNNKSQFQIQNNYLPSDFESQQQQYYTQGGQTILNSPSLPFERQPMPSRYREINFQAEKQLNESHYSSKGKNSQLLSTQIDESISGIERESIIIANSLRGQQQSQQSSNCHNLSTSFSSVQSAQYGKLNFRSQSKG